jgi:hypothetical protein
MRRENRYQKHIILRLRTEFPGCVILKNDSDYLPGILDLTVLFGQRWGLLEVKAYEGAPERPNQRHYQEQLNDMSFAAFIYPENEEEVFDALRQTFYPRGFARVS